MEESRPLLFFNFRGGLLSSIFPKNSSKCLKTAILPLKPITGLKVDIFKEIVILSHLGEDIHPNVILKTDMDFLYQDTKHIKR